MSMAWDICVFEHVRGCGRDCWPSSRSSGCLLVDDFCVFTGVVGLLAVVSVVSVVWVACWWTTFVVLGWAFRVFEVVGLGVGLGLGRFVACVWSPRVLVRRASVV